MGRPIPMFDFYTAGGRSHVRSELGPARREVVVSVKDARSRPGDAAGRAR